MQKLSFVTILVMTGLFLTGCFVLQEAEESSGAVEAEAVETSSNASVFVIDAEQSEARFLLDEVLRGADVTVVGVTSNLAGEVAIDFDAPSSTQFGPITVDARDITTDSNFRNNAIRNSILETDTYEFVTFIPSSVSGLPDSATVGESYEVQITGDLNITDVTLEKTFDATITVDSDSQISGLASSTFPYADFELEIPFSQSVDAVADDVTLEIEFIAISE